ncbi:MAG: hypothetical protein ACPHUF_11840 [Gammaproteobacteria bacterium]
MSNLKPAIHGFTSIARRFCARLLPLVLAALSAQATEPSAFDAEYAATLIWEARQRGDYFPDLYRLNPDLSEARLYEVQDAFVRRQLAAGDQIAGFKGGFVPSAPVGGVIGTRGLLKNHASISHGEFRLLIIEAEIAFRFCQPVTTPLQDVAALKELVCAVMPAMEIADGAIRDFSDVRKDFTHLRNALLAVNVAARQIMLGEPTDATAVNLKELPVSMRSQDKPLGDRNLENTPDLWANVLWVVNEYVLKRGYIIEPGQIIIPGNLTGIHAVTNGHYVGDFGALGRLELTVTP